MSSCAIFVPRNGRRHYRTIFAANAAQSAGAEYVPPEQFDAYRDYGLAIGFRMVFSGPAGAQFLYGRSGER